MPDDKDTTLGQSSVPADAGAEATEQKEPVEEAGDPVTVVRGDNAEKGVEDSDTPTATTDAPTEEKKSVEQAGEGDEVKKEEKSEEGVPEEGEETQEPTTQKKEPAKGEKPEKDAKEKKHKKAKQLKPKIHMRDIPGIIFPEHLGDIFVVMMIFALAAGAAVFWLLAWIPTNEAPEAAVQENIQQFSDEELQEILTILENREEASKAPVIPPERDPFF